MQKQKLQEQKVQRMQKVQEQKVQRMQKMQRQNAKNAEAEIAGAESAENAESAGAEGAENAGISPSLALIPYRPNDANELENGGNNGHNLQKYSVASIREATNFFSLQNKLGEGGFGPVYKGNLVDGQQIAVKRLSKRSGQGLIEFKTELILIATTTHESWKTIRHLHPRERKIIDLLAWEQWKGGRSEEIVDPIISDSAPKDQVLRCISVALLCVEQNPLDRLTMPDVLSMLASDVQLAMPKQPAFYIGTSTATTGGTNTNDLREHFSANGLSLTNMVGR
ncbi:hypothetical protein JCGZ_13536 [Jatropha curcas]|uniref:Protein kinase domain-containing protein n=1 Tax=Jatropha curcas TaxID=180498 RepID=A0A067KMX2_JATCU|nr:hypothetical protein JCGZ_13536 [Jatropha curcas]